MRASPPAPDLDRRLAELEQMELEPLRAEWCRRYRSPPPTRLSRDLLRRGIGYKLQEAAFGGLRPTMRRRLAALIADGDQSAGAPAAPTVALRPGAMLVRSWGGRTHTVQVLENGFEHQGQCYRSLSHVAKAITGAHWSGPRFFGLTKTSGRTSSPNAQAG